ncbi:hypothetical protein MUCCIDRAFT_106179 [Mucor lusitanicus CBS 277.49]|uniref:Uncharacterized protein n=1 Tax=Mucor lusitanicus CBS 277.49 TaxID=747725 RepID=A0A168QG90_MUCCL|nr:hypothetical protein MUCCIDRAFT_106179 [Mucor lusitanicus CBS 277.49]
MDRVKASAQNSLVVEIFHPSTKDHPSIYKSSSKPKVNYSIVFSSKFSIVVISRDPLYLNQEMAL